MSDATDPPARINAYLVAGGRYHDIDFARLELLKLLGEHAEVRVTVAADYEDVEAIAACSFLVSYTCDLRPSERAQRAIRAWVEGGGRWMALHGTNAALDLPRPNGVEAPRCFPVWAETLGSQFIAHPPIQMYPIELADPTHPIVAGFEPFETDDELYLCDYHDRENLHVLLHTHWLGDARGFNEHDWSTGNNEHLVLYVRDLGAGSILYNTLGHCRGHYDMAAAGMAYYPKIERCSWNVPQFHEILRRSISWAKAAPATFTTNTTTT
jgi:uncharacterized protein